MTERIKFYMDEHVPRAVTEGLRRRGVDVLTTQEANMLEADDEQHLAFALREGRVIFTQDADFLRLHAAGRPRYSAGLLIMKRLSLGLLAHITAAGGAGLIRVARFDMAPDRVHAVAQVRAGLARNPRAW